MCTPRGDVLGMVVARELHLVLHHSLPSCSPPKVQGAQVECTLPWNEKGRTQARPWSGPASVRHLVVGEDGGGSGREQGSWVHTAWPSRPQTQVLQVSGAQWEPGVQAVGHSEGQ